MLNHKHKLEQQLEQIESALDDAVAPSRPRAIQSQRQYGELTSAVSSVLAAGPLTQKEIADRLQAAGFKFGGPPLKVVDSVIYTKLFRRSGKQFSLAKPSVAKPAEKSKSRGLVLYAWSDIGTERNGYLGESASREKEEITAAYSSLPP